MEFCLLYGVGIHCVVVYVSTVVVHGTMAIVANRLSFFCGVVLFVSSLQQIGAKVFANVRSLWSFGI